MERRINASLARCMMDLFEKFGALEVEIHNLRWYICHHPQVPVSFHAARKLCKDMIHDLEQAQFNHDLAKAEDTEAALAAKGTNK